MAPALWASALNQARATSDAAGSDNLHVAVEALLCGFKGSPAMESYSLLREAGMLLAAAGHIDRALTLARNDLQETPAQWEGALVYAAVIARMILDNRDSEAVVILREAAAAAENVSVYERGDNFPGLYDLMEALDWFALSPLVGVVVGVLSVSAEKAIVLWQQNCPAPRIGYPGSAPVSEGVDADVVDAIAAENLTRAIEMADASPSAYVRIVNFTAVARAAAKQKRADTAEEALRRALNLQAGSFGEEGRRALIYHESFRFRAAQRLGDAAQVSLTTKQRHTFAREGFERAFLLNDAFEGAGLVVAAGRAAIAKTGRVLAG